MRCDHDTDGAQNVSEWGFQWDGRLIDPGGEGCGVGSKVDLESQGGAPLEVYQGAPLEVEPGVELGTW